MNWTEGNLNRHSRARKGKETLLRQKEHFAKVRAGLLDANVKISPTSVSVLAVPARPPSSVRRGALKSTSSASHQNGNQLLTSRYFSGPQATMPAPSRLPDEDTEEATRQKRRKLLLKGDWVGTNVQKPIEMEFTKPGGSPIPWDTRKSRLPASKRKLRKLFGLANHGGDNRAHLTAANTSTPTSLRQIKVRVGHYERALGDSSNASFRSRDSRVGMSGSIGKPSRQISKLDLKEYARGPAEQCPPGQPVYRRQRGHHRNQGRVSATISISSHRSQSAASQTPLLTTSPLLFHPVPTRPALLQLLGRHSADSDNADSTFAQVGAERPDVLPSQAEENDVWKTFVARPDGMSTSSEMGTADDLKVAAQGPISPGVSQLGTLTQLQDTSKATAAVSPVGGGSDETCSDTDQDAPDAVDDSPPRPGFDHPQPSESPSCDTDTMKGQDMTAQQSSDELSLLATPSSPEFLPSTVMVDQLATFNIDQTGNSVSSDQELPVAPKKVDDNDMWKKFVFGESSENLEQALEETRRETARNLQAPFLLTSISSFDESQRDSTTSPVKSDFTNRRNSAEGVSTTGTISDAFDTAPASHVATAGTSTSSTDSEVTLESMDTAARTDQATRGSSGSSSTNGSGTGRVLFHKELVRPSVREVDTGPTTNNLERLEKHGEADESFRFARPKLFVGKKMGQVDEQKQIALSAPQIRGTTQSRRRQKRANDGRANIKKLPNYGSDPIEDFEGDVRSDRAEK